MTDMLQYFKLNEKKIFNHRKHILRTFTYSFVYVGQFWELDNLITCLETRDGHDTDTKYRYCRYLRVRVKYRYFHQVLLVFDTEPALFMVSMYV